MTRTSPFRIPRRLKNPALGIRVIDMQRHYQGVDTRWTTAAELLVPVTFTTGPELRKHERKSPRYENFVMNNGVPVWRQRDKRRDGAQPDVEPRSLPANHGSSQNSLSGVERACVQVWF